MTLPDLESIYSNAYGKKLYMRDNHDQLALDNLKKINFDPYNLCVVSRPRSKSVKFSKNIFQKKNFQLDSHLFNQCVTEVPLINGSTSQNLKIRFNLVEKEHDKIEGIHFEVNREQLKVDSLKISLFLDTRYVEYEDLQNRDFKLVLIFNFLKKKIPGIKQILHEENGQLSPTDKHFMTARKFLMKKNLKSHNLIKLLEASNQAQKDPVDNKITSIRSINKRMSIIS